MNGGPVHIVGIPQEWNMPCLSVYPSCTGIASLIITVQGHKWAYTLCKQCTKSLRDQLNAIFPIHERDDYEHR